jgi:2-polyprenyl-3-methyl-5-hydroxy-6-metoxy-1,4-benzoquinol methylase
MQKILKKIERKVLTTFKKENPSTHFSNKGKREFKLWQKNLDFAWNNLMHFPPKMFEGCSLIDFGAGTGENTIHFANWGANCTLVDNNKDALKIAKKVFKKYSKNINKHKFNCSSIFNYKSKKKYDIVVSQGAIHHTNDKNKAFKKIISFLKPNGYIILSLSNPSGGFQNNLQRLLVYKFAKNWHEMIKVAEQLFREDISRSQKYSKRTRKEIIFDRYVVPKQDDPSIRELLQWFHKSKIKLYSSYPQITPSIFADSWLNSKFDLKKIFKNIGSLPEAIWLSHKNDDNYDVPKILNSLNKFSNTQHSMTKYINNMEPNTKIKFSKLEKKIKLYEKELTKVDYLSYIKQKQFKFLIEVKKLLKLTKGNDFNKIKVFLKKNKILIKGLNGIRSVYFIGRKL